MPFCGSGRLSKAVLQFKSREASSFSGKANGDLWTFSSQMGDQHVVDHGIHRPLIDVDDEWTDPWRKKGCVFLWPVILLVLFFDGMLERICRPICKPGAVCGKSDRSSMV